MSLFPPFELVTNMLKIDMETITTIIGTVHVILTEDVNEDDDDGDGDGDGEDDDDHDDDEYDTEAMKEI